MVTGFVRGVVALPRALRIAFGDQTLRRWLIAPVLLAAVLLVATITGGVGYLAHHRQGDLAAIAAVGAMALGCVAAILLATSPFGGALSDRTEEIALDRVEPRPTVARFLAEALLGIGHLLGALALYLAASLALLAVGLVLPFLAPLWSIAHVLQTALFIAWGACDPALTRRRFAFRHKWLWIRAQLGEALGLGVVTAILLAISLVGLVAAPMSIVAGALLVVDWERRNAPPPG